MRYHPKGGGFANDHRSLVGDEPGGELRRTLRQRYTVNIAPSIAAVLLTLAVIPAALAERPSVGAGP